MERVVVSESDIRSAIRHALNRRDAGLHHICKLCKGNGTLTERTVYRFFNAGGRASQVRVRSVLAMLEAAGIEVVLRVPD